MLDKAAELAQISGVADHITFVKGALEDLSAYAGHSFDLVMSFDAPVSYTWPNQENVLANLVRICKKRIMLSVSSRLGSLPYLANPLQKNQFILDENCDDPWVNWCVSNYQNAIDQFSFSQTACMDVLENGLMGGSALMSAASRKRVIGTASGETCLLYTSAPCPRRCILQCSAACLS